MNNISIYLIVFGSLLLASRLARYGASRLHIPQVSLLLILGVLIGPVGLNVLPKNIGELYPQVAEIALSMVGFLLGGELSLDNLKKRGRDVFVISLLVTICTFIIVALGGILFGLSIPLTLIIAAAATATDPAACQTVVRDINAKGEMTKTLLGVVAIDDLWGILLFSGIMTFLSTLSPTAEGHSFLHGLYEVGGSILLGGILGSLMAILTGRLTKGSPTLEEAIGFILLAAGLSNWLGLSYLLVAVFMGIMVANFAKHHTHTFREIEEIEWPTLIIFFILSGASLVPSGFKENAWLILGYIILRILGRVIGGAFSQRLLHSQNEQRHQIGLALLPQAGVALGMILVASKAIPSVGEKALTIVTMGTIFFELLGPILTRRILILAGDTPHKKYYNG